MDQERDEGMLSADPTGADWDRLRKYLAEEGTPFHPSDMKEVQTEDGTVLVFHTELPIT